jgi:hypothetical protein
MVEVALNFLIRISIPAAMPMKITHWGYKSVGDSVILAF